MSQSARTDHRRTARFRRQMMGLARAAAEILRAGDSVQRAFVTLSPAALDAFGVAGVSLWERTSPGTLECRATWPPNPTHQGLGRRESSAATATRAERHDHLLSTMPGWLGELAQAGIGAVLDVPVVVGGELWGRMVFESRSPRAWQADEEIAALHFADVFGVAIERERRRAAEAQLTYLEMYDDTSGVANRSLFVTIMRQQIKRMRRNPSCGSALLFVDVDRFHSVNEFFGEAGGNAALAIVADRLHAVTPNDASIGRVESDCFGVLLPSPGAEWRVTLIAERILEAVSQPIVQGERSWQATASIGIAFGSASPDFSAEEWLRDADMASKEAKQAGRSRVHVYDPEQHQSLMDRLSIEQGLRDALREHRIEVVYQPEFDLDTGEIVGAEALARWRREPDTLVAAGDFIEVAEATGLIEPIGRIVLVSACLEARDWPAMADGSHRSVRVNVSARQFTSGTLVAEVDEAITVSGIEPWRLCLEITETTVMAKADESMDHLRALKALGVCLAIDDFGTGYSSLSYLKRFPVDALKLDKSMVDGVESDDTVQAILRAVQGLASSLQLHVVVEGVERDEQIEPLRRLGIHRVQGFYFARPEAPESLRQRLRDATG
ncbi:putative bifunctional diguanylate cyclase/phosphodiesterase [Cognatilysobacter terrigena]|uniref:putative bifunctional diguanylate cyclase/phosphodiesterase n=1 Tax=Cognatilysobacter terrigena TaxID=2488749 RepID=UPI00105BF487|nr:bifunctional diguanylate cyclase/phosphodiesterase [Lysobacter terrigena]